MALTVTEIEALREYLNGVMARADHHAGNVKEIALALAGAILWRKNDNELIRAMVHDGETKNVLSVRIGAARYAFSYNHISLVMKSRCVAVALKGRLSTHSLMPRQCRRSIKSLRACSL